MPQKFFLTTPIYYVNDVPHVGHAYTTIAADVLARYHRFKGEEVFFLTGSDEHGQKIQQSAEDQGETPQALADRVVLRFQELWKLLNISHDDFIRTTEKRHRDVVQSFFKKVKAQGDIYLGEYEDWYCTPCETFLTEGQLVNGKCPSCGRDVKKLKEASYFFKLSAYEKRLLEFYEKNPDFIQPESRRNEVISFVKTGLRDLSLSRTTFNWGVPVPDDPKHVIYVWFDALLNYISALGYGLGDQNSLFKSFWPADLHIVGKDIIRFHAIYWPAFLMSGGLELPKKIFAHGWWTSEGKKMSKSLGNVIDPVALVEKYGADPFRYFLLREVPFGQDGNFSMALFERRLNADLANDLGNLLSRALGMYEKYLGKVELPNIAQELLSETPEDGSPEADLKEIVNDVYSSTNFLDQHLDNLDFQGALEGIWRVIGAANRFIDRVQPWKLFKEEPLAHKNRPLVRALVYGLEVLRLSTLAIYAFMPQKALEMWQSLGIAENLEKLSLSKDLQWGLFPGSARPQKGAALFPRIQSSD